MHLVGAEGDFGKGGDRVIFSLGEDGWVVVVFFLEIETYFFNADHKFVNKEANKEFHSSGN